MHTAGKEARKQRKWGVFNCPNDLVPGLAWILRLTHFSGRFCNFIDVMGDCYLSPNQQSPAWVANNALVMELLFVAQSAITRLGGK